MNFDISQLSLQALKDGFTFDEKTEYFRCLLCDAAFQQGVVYPSDACYLDAHRAMRRHIETAHGSPAAMLLSQDKRTTGLTDAQKEMLSAFFSGLSDKEIAGLTGTSSATVRSQRFAFREKARQAKVILALSELLTEKPRTKSDTLVDVHGGATMVDERYMVTDAQAEKVEKTFFSSLDPLVLDTFPAREKNKIIILRKISGQFSPAQKYTEKQVNATLKAIYSDFATLRRYLIEYGFMDREKDGSLYWLKEA